MKITARIITLFILFIVMVPTSTAQNISLKGRSAVEVNIGFWKGNKTIELASPSSGPSLVAETDNFSGGTWIFILVKGKTFINADNKFIISASEYYDKLL